jgi:glutathione synthase/RimK-type ligase-like ATP-grasp enzyme
MKIAIHHKQGGFSKKWINYCEEQSIDFKKVDCYSSNIVYELEDCDGLMWHFHHMNPKDVLFAKQLLFSLEHSGKQVFPDFKTMWHFDDKVAQKYLLESVDAPLIPSYVFYSKEEALKWVDHARFPKVFKLRSGSGASHVKILNNRDQGRNAVSQAFGRGFSQYDKLGSVKERMYQYKQGNGGVINVLKGILRFAAPTEFSKVKGKERGYAYFQDFISGLDHDIRVIVINGKAIAIKRLVRDGDFRASGSGKLQYKRELFDESIINEAFILSEKLVSQSLAIDFVLVNGVPKILEISYGFPEGPFVENCEGYWDKSLNWHRKNVNTEGWMVESVVKEIKRKEDR